MPARVLRPKKDIVGLIGDAKIKWKDGDVVWAKFDDFPWWPGQIHLKDTDHGKDKIPVQWFGDYGDKIDSCERDKVLPFDVSYKEKIKKEVNRPDKNSFQESIEEATRVQKSHETKENSQNAQKKSNVTTRSRRSARRIIMNKEKTSEENKDDKKNDAPAKRSLRRRRSSTASSPALNTNTESSNEANGVKNRNRRRKRNRPSTGSDTKKEKEEQEENEEEENKENDASGHNKEKEENFNELKNKAKKIIFDNNNDNQLNIFMGFIYYHCRTIMNENKSTEFICNLFNIKESEFEKHLEDFDFEASKPERKRRRKNT